MSGLYIDGQFEGALQSRAALDALLDGILAAYRNGSEGERAEFIQKVEITDGLYPLSSVVEPDVLATRLTAATVVEKRYTAVPGDSMGRIANLHDMSLSALRAMNPQIENDKILVGDQVVVQRPQPYLRVQVTRTVTYTEEIPYSTTEEKDAKQYTTYKKVKTEGQNGIRTVNAEVVLVDGVEQSREVRSAAITKAPVNKVVVVGTKKKTNSPSAGASSGTVKSTGQFIWPVPDFKKQVYAPFGSRHKGIDISQNGINGARIVAADGGVVVEAVYSGYGMGWGHHVVIQHPNGLKTRYAHCNKVLVKVGDTVVQGQKIATVGSTGDSRAPHLHFEVLENNVRVNPMKYLK